MFTSKCSLVLSLIICFLTFTSVVWAKDQTATFTTIDYPDAVHTYALGINSEGDIVGGYDDSAGDEHGFVLRDGIFTSFDWPGATWTEGFGINPRGDIVGQYGWFDGVTNMVHGFLLRDGLFYPIDIPGQQNTMPYKISPEGVIVGCNHHNITNLGGTDMNTMMGFSLDAAGVISQTMSRSMNTGVNPSGDVVGYYFGNLLGQPTATAGWSYLIRNGVMTWFQFPGSFATLATDINPSGTIVGAHRTALTGSNQFHGFVMEEGEMASFDAPGATETRALGISARGDIVGYFRDSTGYHGFLRSR